MSGNVEVSKELSVSGNVEIAKELTVSGNVEVGTANLFVDTVSGRVGIGVVSPDKRLHVYTGAGEGNTQLHLQSADRYSTIQMLDDTGAILFGNDRGAMRFITGYDASLSGGSEAMRITGSGNVGIGSDPERKLHITHTDDNNDLLLLEPRATQGDNAIYGGIQFKHSSGHATGYRGITWHNTNYNFFMGGVTMAVGSNYNNCRIGFHAAASRANGATLRAYLDSGNNGNRITTFTGQHRCFIKDVPFTRAKEFEGMIVSTTESEYIKLNEGVTRGLNAITINESVPLVSISRVVNDKKCFGVISHSEDPENRVDRYGNFVNIFEKENGDIRVYINSLGEGAIWVTNINGPLESGDYITTSNIFGYGQKQNSDSLKNYTVAKITMDCDFNPISQPVRVIRKEMNNNVLDEHGQLQWEDTDETEKAYQVRYLLPDGTQISEEEYTNKALANEEVYIAAFVGCTYHCG